MNMQPDPRDGPHPASIENIERFPTRGIGRRRRSDGHAEGQALVEYSLIFVLIIIVSFGAAQTMGDKIDQGFFQVVQSLP